MDLSHLQNFMMGYQKSMEVKRIRRRNDLLCSSGYLTNEDLIYLKRFLNCKQLNAWGLTSINIHAIKCQKLSSRLATLNDLK